MPAAMTPEETANAFEIPWRPDFPPSEPDVDEDKFRRRLASLIQAERDAATAADIAVLEQMEAGLKVGKYPDLQAAAVVGQCIAAIRGGRQP